jgi:hypothetical protein
VEARAGSVLALTRDDFVFENPHLLVYRPSLFGLTSGLSVGVEF